MKSKTIQKAVRSACGALIAILLLFSAGLRVPVLDTTTDGYFRAAISKAGVVYATCRLINASVSVAKNSSLGLEPAGVGVTLALGQALDPVDDMTERVSDVMVTAITSLGVQKLVYEIGVSIVPPILAIFILILSGLIWFEDGRLATTQKIIIRLILLILIARFALPVSAIANNYLQEHFFNEEISNADKELAVGCAEIEKLIEFSLPEIDGIVGTIQNSSSFLKRKSLEFKDAIVATISNAGSIIENLLKLVFLYVGVFLIQVIALPLMAFWLLLKAATIFFDTQKI